MYDPSIGRFTSQDTFPIDGFNPSTIHRYSYAWNNPVNLIDPSGRFPEEVKKLADEYNINKDPNILDKIGRLLEEAGIIPGKVFADDNSISISNPTQEGFKDLTISIMGFAVAALGKNAVLQIAGTIIGVIFAIKAAKSLADIPDQGSNIGKAISDKTGFSEHYREINDLGRELRQQYRK